MVPLLGVTGFTIIVAVWTSVAFLALLPVEFLVMKSLTRNEPMRFSLIAVWLRARGKPAANRLFGATVFMPVEHDAVDITEFLNAMKLNQCATLRKYIPYSSHIHQHVVRSPHSDLYCTWELTGTPFDCESEETLSIDRNQLHGLIRSFEGMPVTFISITCGSRLPIRCIRHPATLTPMKSAVCIMPRWRRIHFAVTACS